MRQKYLCASCDKKFPLADAVDGFPAGYKKGFLCPFCKANLTEAGESTDIFQLRGGHRYATLAVVLLLLNALLDLFLVGLLIFGIATIALVAANWKAIFGTHTIYTRKLPNTKLQAGIEQQNVPIQ